MKRLCVPLFLFMLAIVLGMASPVKAEGELDEIYRLADEKKLDQAMRKLEEFLKIHPRDAQARFLQGLIFTGKSRNDDAIRVFQELGAEFPDLPEPFNNLAVLYAERGEYEKARQALVSAIRILPNYATAHENLGDIYAKLASQSYAHALRINGANDFVFAKLALMKKLFTLPNTPPRTPTTHASADVDADVDTQASRVDLPAEITADTLPSPRTPAATVAAVIDTPDVSPETLLDVQAETLDAETLAEMPRIDGPEASTEAPIDTSTAPSSEDVRTEVEQTVYAWAKAWSARDSKSYLRYYAADFVFPKKAGTRKAWERGRRWVLKKAAEIRVTLTNMEFTMLGPDRAKVSFTQGYWSPRYQDQVKKFLTLQKEGNVWRIVLEES